MELLSQFHDHRQNAFDRFLSGVILVSIGALLLLAAASSASAQQRRTHYLDVEAGAWYEEAAAGLLASGALDERESRLRPNDLASRAEVMKMLVQLYGETLIYPSTASFSDVPKTAWYYPYVETAARAGIIRGDRNCYQSFRPCTARPGDGVNRAEMAILLQRAYALDSLETAPVFPDNRRGTWYFEPIQTAADHCILQGDDRTGNVRPAAFMNRAEMVAMSYRASLHQEYGVDCGVSVSEFEIRSAMATSLDRVRVAFNVDLNLTIANEPSRYIVERVGGERVIVDDVRILSDDTVELDLVTALRPSSTYRVTAQNVRTDEGQTFTDVATFVAPPSVTPAIQEIEVRSMERVRVSFTVDVDPGRADDAFRYIIERAGGGGTITVESATMIDDRTVELDLMGTLSTRTTYTLIAEDLRTESDVEFTDSESFTTTEPVAELNSVSAVSPTRVRLTFNVSLDETRAEQPSRYRVSANNRDLSIGGATLVSDMVVELTLDESLQSQREYTVNATNLLTNGGLSFSDIATLLYAPSDVQLRSTLSGLQEVPAVITNASGTGVFTLTSSALQYDITVRNLSGSSISGAHFHRGDTGIEGPILETIPLTGSRVIGVWNNLTAQERDDLLSGDIYVNIHSQLYPEGEIRGQVERQ